MSRSQRRCPGFVLVLLSLVLVTGCGSDSAPERSAAPPGETAGASARPAATDRGGVGADDGGADDRGGDSVGGKGGGGDADGDREKFSWGLPGGDLSLDALGDVFNQLRAGRCAEAQTRLEAFLQNEQVFSVPGQEQLWRAAIAVCAGDLRAGRALFAGAVVTRHPGDCRLWTAITSVLDQRAQSSIQCRRPAGATTSPEATQGTPGASSGPTTGPGTSTELPTSAASTGSAAPAPDPAGVTPPPSGGGGTDSAG